MESSAAVPEGSVSLAEPSKNSPCGRRLPEACWIFQVLGSRSLSCLRTVVMTDRSIELPRYGMLPIMDNSSIQATSDVVEWSWAEDGLSHLHNPADLDDHPPRFRIR